MQPRPEIAHWWFGSVFLLLGLILLAEVIVGPGVFGRRPWRRYLWPATALASGVLLWLVAALSTFSTLHLIAHSIWAQTAMIAGGVELALVRGPDPQARRGRSSPPACSPSPGPRSSCTSRTAGSSPAPPSCITRSAGC